MTSPRGREPPAVRAPRAVSNATPTRAAAIDTSPRRSRHTRERDDSRAGMRRTQIEQQLRARVGVPLQQPGAMRSRTARIAREVRVEHRAQGGRVRSPRAPRTSGNASCTASSRHHPRAQFTARRHPPFVEHRAERRTAQQAAPQRRIQRGETRRPAARERHRDQRRRRRGHRARGERAEAARSPVQPRRIRACDANAGRRSRAAVRHRRCAARCIARARRRPARGRAGRGTGRAARASSARRLRTGVAESSSTCRYAIRRASRAYRAAARDCTHDALRRRSPGARSRRPQASPRLSASIETNETSTPAHRRRVAPHRAQRRRRNNDSAAHTPARARARRTSCRARVRRRAARRRHASMLARRRRSASRWCGRSVIAPDRDIAAAVRRVAEHGARDRVEHAV